MAQAMIQDRPDQDIFAAVEPTPAPAAGLFGYSIASGELRTFKPMAGYIRELEQMPNFSPPSVAAFVARYVGSNIGKNASSS